MQLVQRRLAGMGIEFLLDASAYGSTLISCRLPAGHSYKSLHHDLKARGFVIYAAQGELKESAFRLGLIGHFGHDEVTAFLDSLAELLGR